jgi:hypothetical protein
MGVTMDEIETRALLLQPKEAALHGDGKCELPRHMGKAPQE